MIFLTSGLVLLLAKTLSASPVPDAFLAAALDADAGAAVCGPAAPACEAVTGAITAVAVGWSIFSTVSDQTYSAPDDPAYSGQFDKPPPGEPYCTPTADNDVNMTPDPAADNKGPCSVHCKDCHFAFTTSSQTSKDGPQFTDGTLFNNWKLTGGLQLKCTGEGKGKYKLTLAESKNKFGMATQESCTHTDVSYQEEIDFDVAIEAEYEVEGSGYIEADFEFTTWHTPATGQSGDFEIINVSGFMTGKFDASAVISATVKDLLLVDNEIVAGLGMSSQAKIALDGAAVQLEVDDPDAPSISLGPYITDWRSWDWDQCMTSPEVTGLATINALVIGPGGATRYVTPWKNNQVTFAKPDMVCAFYDDE